MSDILKCPFCQQKLRNCCAGVIYTCSNPDSCPHEQCYGSKELWQELIRTRKALDVAVDALKNMNEIIKNYEYGNGLYYALDGHDTMLIAEYVEKALDQITALEQKD